MSEASIPDTEERIVELVEDVPEHIRFAESSTALCDAEIPDDCTSRTLPAVDDPLASASLHLCQDCANSWPDTVDTITRAATVRCNCDRIEDSGEVYTCGKTVSASAARAMKHPNSNAEYVPVCPDCYQWLKNQRVSSITTPYADAIPWTDVLEKNEN